ncbi:alpha-amylase family glycosyl hydrolase [Thermococcus atlanticus]
MRKVLAVLFIFILLAPGVLAYQIPEKGVIYQIMVDRFYDGNQSNDRPFYDPDHRDYYLYWGGDLQGITEKLDYIKSLGVSMIWLSPINDNINRMAGISAPYHGYWTHDYKRIEEHFGNWKTFERLVEEAKKRNMCIIVGFVPNHSNPEDDGEFGSLYDNGTKITDFFRDEKNATVNPYTGSLEYIYHHNGNVKNYYGWEMKSKSIFGLADFNQLNPWVDSYLKESLNLFIKAGVCGFRMDAVKHMDLGWLTNFYAYAYRRAPLLIYGEYYRLKYAEDADMYDFYRYSNISPLLSIPIRDRIVSTLGFGGSFAELADYLHEYYAHFVYPNKAVNFIDNHDLPRFLSESPGREGYHMALGLLMTLPGIPVIYYGDESYLVSREGKGDPYNRPMMVFNNTTEAARIIRTLAELRKENNALAYGDFRDIYKSYTTWAFERSFGGERVLVVLNKREDRALEIPLNWSDGAYRDVLYGVEMSVKDGKATLEAPKNRILVFSFKGRQEKPLIGSVTPYLAQPGDKIVLGGVAFGKGGKVTVGGRDARVLEWSDGMVVFEMPEIRTKEAWVNVTVESGGKRSNAVRIRYLSGEQRAALLVVNGSYVNATGQLWIKGDIPELAEPIPLYKSPTGYYFQVVSLPVEATFEVQLYRGSPWGELEPLNITLYGKSNGTVILRNRPYPREKHEYRPVYGAIAVLGLILILLSFRRR